MSSLRRKIESQVAFIGVILMTLSGCGHEPLRRVADHERPSLESVAAPETRRRTLGEQAAVVALRQIGVPYRYGGSTEEGFDCSGLVQFAYANAGKRIPRTTAQQWQQLTPIKMDSVRVGDLLFFRIAGKVSHVGLYVGDSRFVHAPSTGRQVSIGALDSDFYRRAFVRAARP